MNLHACTCPVDKWGQPGSTVAQVGMQAASLTSQAVAGLSVPYVWKYNFHKAIGLFQSITIKYSLVCTLFKGASTSM